MDHVFLRSPRAAQSIPQELPDGARRRARGERHRCETHGCELVPVVVTTYGDLGDPTVWRARPLAHDAWQCPVGQHLELGADLSADEISTLSDAGGRAARSGDLDAAEYNFRRVVSAWPGFADGHSNLGAVYVDRVAAAQRAGVEWRPLLDVAIRELSRALACDPPAGAPTRVMLGRILARLERIEEARATLRPVLDDPHAPPQFANLARDLLASFAPAAAPPRGPSFEHADVTFTLPHGWRKVEAPHGLTAMFEGPEHEMVNVAIMPSPGGTEAHLEHLMQHHVRGIHGNYAHCDVEPTTRDDRPAYLCADRVYHVEGTGKPWTIHARYVVSRVAELGSAGLAHPAIQIVYYGSSWGPSPDVVAAVRDARFLRRMALIVEGLGSKPHVASLEEAIERAEIGATRETIEAQWPDDTMWTWDGARQTLAARPEAVDPFEVTYLFADERLTGLRVLIRARGDWSTMALLEQHVTYQLPSFTFVSLRDPWSLDAARGRLEGKGNQRMMAGVMMSGTKPNGTEVSGKAFAFNVEGRQSYGFELTWRPRVTTSNPR